eukprot:TRINITY_DN10413_c0_g1_i1.p1 TRINITY_DN10413_c0_g1~~TRINITY_DN10413_c0_g1_i1.p1  ORF type:complete len:158 (+),score=7.38 TRINITY_DN10413_c0_g1_i1:123-596(+)
MCIRDRQSTWDGDSVTVREVVEKIHLFWPKVEFIIAQNKTAVHEANLLKLDCSKAHQKLKWHGVWNCDTTFQKTIQWYRDFYEKNAVSSLDDLSLYIENAKAKDLEWTKQQKLNSQRLIFLKKQKNITRWHMIILIRSLFQANQDQIMPDGCLINMR